MPYTHGMKWNDKLIAQEIRKIMSSLEIHRMPSLSECNKVAHIPGLTNVICRTYGFYGWADKLGIDIKSSCTRKGFLKEAEMKSILESKGFRAELTSMRCPYDLLVNGIARIDVKFANISKVRSTNCYSFHLEKNVPTCDFYILATSNNKIYIVPSKDACQKQIAIGTINSKYDKYLNRFDLISRFTEGGG